MDILVTIVSFLLLLMILIANYGCQCKSTTDAPPPKEQNNDKSNEG